ncbi:MEKHLA domain-containing protein [Actinoplanes palleronii]|uniref:MEKHLA domain-containing protein n=1 Tax=Actinoplanes palleronii TaxID=113570 RepID=A0ABQ4B6K0_9ACTN|nr:MEKHLA domain-containing protein [Actinoplanes palleronii]GIE65890.1 MEKHLA domain-containing protein [Actinoplanes palleronii]
MTPQLLVDSYRRLTGRELVPEGLHGDKAAEWLDRAPFGLLAHDTATDPVVIYANQKAQTLFAYGDKGLLGLPSRLAAGTQDQQSRQAFMESVLDKGYVDDYRGPRVRKDGTPFWIEDVTIWNLVDADGTLAGQAALIRRTTPA